MGFLNRNRGSSGSGSSGSGLTTAQVNGLIDDAIDTIELPVDDDTELLNRIVELEAQVGPDFQYIAEVDALSNGSGVTADSNFYNNGPFQVPETGPYTISVSGNVIVGSFGVGIRTTPAPEAGTTTGHDVVNWANGSGPTGRLSPTDETREIELELTAGVDYYIHLFAGGGSGVQNPRVEITSVDVDETPEPLVLGSSAAYNIIAEHRPATPINTTTNAAGTPINTGYDLTQLSGMKLSLVMADQSSGRAWSDSVIDVDALLSFGSALAHIHSNDFINIIVTDAANGIISIRDQNRDMQYVGSELLARSMVTDTSASSSNGSLFQGDLAGGNFDFTVFPPPTTGNAYIDSSPSDIPQGTNLTATGDGTLLLFAAAYPYTSGQTITITNEAPNFPSAELSIA